MRTSLAEPLQVTEAERRPTRRWGLALSVHWQGPWAGGGRGNRDVNFRHQYLNMFDLSALLLCSLFALYKFGVWFPVCP